MVARYVYDAFGQREQTVSTVQQDYGFTGREFDTETGLYYYRARHYDPGQGRFIQSDPLGFAAGDLNLYAYTWNDPANWSDPSGLSATEDAAKVGAGGASLALYNAYRVGRGAACVAGKISTVLNGLGQVVGAGNTFNNITGIASLGTVACRLKVKQRQNKKRCGCRANAGGGGTNSFPEGTEVLAPTGRVAIETLREGDLVIGRNEETGQSGAFPVTALMSRQATDVLWLTLENAEGQTTRMGVTSEHPLFVVGGGWTSASDVVAGDIIRDKELRSLTVLAVQVDPTPTRVYNLEITEAHTYFAGEFEAWAHNARWTGPLAILAMTVLNMCISAGEPEDPYDDTLATPDSEEFLNVDDSEYKRKQGPDRDRKPGRGVGSACPVFGKKNPFGDFRRHTQMR